MNNFAACDASVQEALKSVDEKRWGVFDYDCHKGKVIKVLSPRDSLIAREHLRFINENLALFGLHKGQPLHLRHGDHGEQLFNGVRAATGVSGRQKVGDGMFQDENYFELYAFLIDTSSWTYRKQ